MNSRILHATQRALATIARAWSQSSTRLDDIAMDEVRLTTPRPAAIARLKLGDVVYLDGLALHGARGRVPKGRRRGRRPARRRARAHQRQLSLLARGRRASRRELRGGGRYGHRQLPLRKVLDALVRALGRPGHRGQGGSDGARLPRVVRPASARCTSRRSATGWAQPTARPSGAWSTSTGSRSWASPRPSGCSRSSGSDRSSWRATARGGASSSSPTARSTSGWRRSTRSCPPSRWPLRRDHHVGPDEVV